MKTFLLIISIFISTFCISQNTKPIKKESVNKDRNGHFVSKEVTEGDKTILKDRNGHSLGKYDKKTNTTSDMNGHKIGTGNQLNGMIKKK